LYQLGLFKDITRYFVSGLPVGNETKPKLEQSTKATTELTESEKNRAKLERRQSTAPSKTTASSSKGIQIFQRISSY